MEKFDSNQHLNGSEYRDGLADKLREIRNSDPENPDVVKAKAQGYLDARQETVKYKSEKRKHIIEQLERLKIEFYPVNASMTYEEVLKELEKINTDLAQGEKPWRTIDLEEVKKINDLVIHDMYFKDQKEDEEKGKISGRSKRIIKFLKELGIDDDKAWGKYWITKDERYVDPQFVDLHSINSSFREFEEFRSHGVFFVR